MKEAKFVQLRREYLITSGELKSKLGIIGEEILSINLYSGRSPKDEADGKSADTDIWEIVTRDKEEKAK